MKLIIQGIIQGIIEALGDCLAVAIIFSPILMMIYFNNPVALLAFIMTGPFGIKYLSGKMWR